MNNLFPSSDRQVEQRQRIRCRPLPRRLSAALAAVVALLTVCPSSLRAATPVVCFKADAITGVANGGAIATWTNASGNGFNASQPTGSKQPIYVSAAINGYPAVRFNSTNSTSLNFSDPITNDFTMACVFRSTQGSGSGTLYYSGAGLISGEVGGTVNDLGSCLFANGQVCAGTGNPDTAVLSATNYNDGNPHLFVFKRVATSGAMTLYMDGVQVGSAVGTMASLSAPPRLTIGAQQPGGGFFTGDIPEIQIFNVALSAVDRASLESELMVKYGVDRADLVTWYRADALTNLSSGAAVATWPDLSGMGYNATQGTVAKRPTYLTNAVNGFPAVRFNAANSTTLQLSRPVQDDFTLALVFSSTQGSGSGSGFWAGAGLVSGEVGGTANDFGSCLFANGQICAGTGNPDVALLSNTNFNDGKLHVLCLTRCKSAGEATLAVDGLAVGTILGGTASLTAPTTLTLGGISASGGFLSGDLVELLVYSNALSTAQQQSLQSALGAKYSITAATPVNLVVQSSNGVPVLNWSGSAIASSYNVKRSLSANGPYLLTATNISVPVYADTNALSTNYYYVVSGVGGTGVEGSNSSPARLPLTLYTLNSGQAVLNLRSNAGAWDVALSLANGAAIYQQLRPMAVEVVASSGAQTWLTAPYSTVQSSNGQYRCTGSVTSSNGTIFNVTDIYHSDINGGTFQVDRTVSVGSANASDSGFSSKFTLQQSKSGSADDNEWFLPTIWCGTNHVVSKSNLGGYDWLNDQYWFREDRLTLPVVMARQRSSGATLSVTHINPDGSTYAGEDFLNRIIDARMKFGAMGMQCPTQPALGFVFPGTEGEQTQITGKSASSRYWALRAHPVSAGFSHSYSLVVRLTTETNYVSAYEGTWTNAFALFNVTNYACNLDDVYSSGVSILDYYWRSINGAAGVPFRISITNGVVANTNDYNYQLGFTGMEPVNGTVLVRAGLLSTNASYQSKGEQMLDFWATNCLTNGLPKTWYDPIPQTWRADNTWIRTATDGMLGILWGWKYEKQRGVNKTNWLNASIKFGDWIVSQQNSDGSVERIWSYQSGSVADNQLYNTSHVIRYLAELYLATGTNAYRVAATNAGNYFYNDSCARFRHIGGADFSILGADPDKEAVSMSLRACMALHDLTGDSRWLDAATRAAYYYWTWIYSWPVPIPAGSPQYYYPTNRSAVGLSIITMGTSACDSYAATDAFEVYRAYLFSGDSQLLKLARLMLYDTKSSMNWDSANLIPGYGSNPGIMFGEAMSLVVPRGKVTGYYLPWQTANYMEPMMNLQDAFGSYDINSLEQVNLASRQAANNAYSLTRGFPSSQAISSAPAGLNAVTNGGVINLSWNSTPTGVFFNLKRSTSTNGPFTLLSSQKALTFVDSNASWNVKYYYTVSTLNAGGESTNASPVSAMLEVNPVLIWSVPANGNLISLSWPAWASNFNLYTATNLTGSASWQLTTNPIFFTNGVWQMTLTNLSEPQQFFRLSN